MIITLRNVAPADAGRLADDLRQRYPGLEVTICPDLRDGPGPRREARPGGYFGLAVRLARGLGTGEED